MIHLLPAASPLGHALPTLAAVLVASAWQGMALVLLAALTLRLLPGLSPSVRGTFWTAVLVLTAALPLGPLLSRHVAKTGVANHTFLHVAAQFSFAVVTLWLAASTFRLAQLVLSAVHLRTLLRRAEPLSPTPAIAALLRTIGHPIRLCSSSQIDRPSVAGFFRPCILIPAALLGQLSDDEFHQILLHEREHLRRGDHWINLLGQLTLVLFPLSPALLWINRRLALERELACDDSVLRATAAPKAYAACLARVAEGSLLHRGLSLAIGILGAKRRPELNLRVERILGTPARVTGQLQTRFAMASLCVSLLGGSAVLARSP